MKKLKLIHFYWIIPILLLIAQSIYTFDSFNQIRIEEINDSVRDVYWMQYQELFTTRPKNVGWYAPLLVIYNAVGFNLFTAKFVKLIIHLISLIALAALLRKFLAEKRAIIPLVALGLSPTLLYYTMLEIPVGLDFQYLPISLYLLLTINFKNRLSAYIKQLLLWSTISIAIMSYPTFLFYLPSLSIYYIYLLFKQTNSLKARAQNILFSVGSLLLPWFLIFLYLKDKKVLLNGEGLINGAATLKFTVETFFDHFYWLLDHLFNKSTGYYIEVSKVEFSDLYPILSLIFITVIIISIIRKKSKLCLPILLALLVLGINLFFGNMTSDIEVGLRRFTGVICVIYFFFVLAWFHSLLPVAKKYQLISLGLLILIPFHHMLVFVPNLEFLSKSRKFAENYWFAQGQTPVDSLNQYIDQIQQRDIEVTCLDINSKPTFCRYDLIFSAVKGYCDWNRLLCHDMYARDPKTGQLKRFTIYSGI